MSVEDDEFRAFASAEIDGLLRYATVLTGDRELGRDLVQDVLLKVHRRWSSVAAVDHRLPYVRKMLVREFLSFQRRWSTRSVVLAGHDSLEGPALPDHAVQVVERDAIVRRLAALPPRQRTVLVLRYYERLSDSEIAAMLGCSPVTVRGYAARALAALRIVMQPPLIATGDTR